MQYGADYSEDLKPSWNLMIALFCETAAALILYGIYLAFFVLSVYTLSRRQRTPGTTLLIIVSCAMAVLGTAQVVVIFAAAAVDGRFVQHLVYGEAAIQPALLTTLGRVVSVLFATNNLVGETLFLYRCYVIWGSQWRVIVLPASLMVPTFVIAILWGGPPTPHADVRIAYTFGAATNLILTASTSGRILWIQHVTSRAGLRNTARKRARVAIGVILESGAMYCIGAIFLALSAPYQSQGSLTFHYTAIGIAGQLLNIIPTFTLVYVGLKNTPDESDVSLEIKRTVSFNGGGV
ncbi:hypothetical protein MSAN_02100400 [Mycena sanguinolenta]|uniref:Uncharacterized protein n=1 Tax=Mycena sanguinolenta TaxID=230812 RepID=A0A8H7CLR2_9AGAR|nr:hypothetical protein MSAN_02100400 [Mycena sanguinolenta]